MKTPCISFVCPSCNSSFEVFLKKQPHLITFDCPTCKTSLSFYDGQAIIDDDLRQKLKYVKTQSDLDSIINNYSKQKSKQVSLITSDDITNLKIDLALCNSFDDVMKLLCKT